MIRLQRLDRHRCVVLGRARVVKWLQTHNPQSLLGVVQCLHKDGVLHELRVADVSVIGYFRHSLSETGVYHGARGNVEVLVPRRGDVARD